MNLYQNFFHGLKSSSPAGGERVSDKKKTGRAFVYALPLQSVLLLNIPAGRILCSAPQVSRLKPEMCAASGLRLSSLAAESRSA